MPTKRTKKKCQNLTLCIVPGPNVDGCCVGEGKEDQGEPQYGRAQRLSLLVGEINH